MSVADLLSPNPKKWTNLNCHSLNLDGNIISNGDVNINGNITANSLDLLLQDGIGVLSGTNVQTILSSPTTTFYALTTFSEFFPYQRNITYDQTTGDYTIGLEGLYNVSASITFSANATGCRSVLILNNDDFSAPVAISSVQAVTASGIPTVVNCSGMVLCNVGDKISINCQQDSGLNNITLGSNGGLTNQNIVQIIKMY